MQNKYRAGFLSIVVALAFGLPLTGCGKSKAAAPHQQGSPEVGIIVVKPERVEITTELPGRTSAYLVAEVRPQVGGIVQKRLFEEGSEVKEGEVLYEIDPSTYQAA